MALNVDDIQYIITLKLEEIKCMAMTPQDLVHPYVQNTTVLCDYNVQKYD